MSNEKQPAIVSPVSRHISVADAVQSVNFYRDILGFEPREANEDYGYPVIAEVISGPARIRLRSKNTGDNLEESKPVLFFQTDDVVGMREKIVARGGDLSQLEKVNWIKMQMFEIRDPDGHVLWFGQSYHEPDKSGPIPQCRQALPDLRFDDVAAAVKYYCDVLGFKINYYDNGDVGVIDRDKITLLLGKKTDEFKGIGSCYIYINDADALHAELTANGANVQGEPISHPWGLRDFSVLDLDGNKITFGQPFE